MFCPCFKYESGLKKNKQTRGKVDNILLPHKQKSHEALADTNNEHTVGVLCQRHDFIVLYHFLYFFGFLVRNLKSFCSSFHYCNWPENSSHHAFSRHHINYEWLIFRTTTLIPGTTLIKNDSSFSPPRLFWGNTSIREGTVSGSVKAMRKKQKHVS